MSTLGGNAGVVLGDMAGRVTAGISTLGDGRVTGANTLGAAAFVGETEEAGVVARVKMSLRRWMAPRRASSGVWKGAWGWGLERASASVMAARVASSAGDEMGQAQLWGKKATVFGVRSPRVDGI